MRALVFLFTFLLSYPYAKAVTVDNPYHTILDRNPFGLNPPVVAPTKPPEEPPRNVKFNGITDVGGRRKAFFTIAGKDKAPPQYVTLAESERADVLELTKIFKEEGEVEVINSGIKMVLNFKNNGNAVVPTAAPTPVSAPAPATVAMSPVYIPQQNNPVVAGAAHMNGGGAAQPNYSQQPALAGMQNANPVVFNGMASSHNSPNGQGSSAQVDPVQQRMNMLAQHAAASAAYQNGETKTIYQPQTDAKVFAPGGIPRQIRMPPPPPLPPAPPALSAATGE